MDKLVLDHNVDDIIQLALLLPETSPIYKQAAEIVEKEKLFWLCWKWVVYLSYDGILTKENFDEFDEFLVTSIFNSSNSY